MGKKIQSALFSPLGRWTGNNFLFEGGRGLIIDKYGEYQRYFNSGRNLLILMSY